MDLINRLILGVVYAIVGIAIGGASFAAFHLYGRSGLREDLAQIAQSDAERESARGGGDISGSVRGVHIQQIYTQRAQIARLQKLLDQKTALLDRKTSLLNEKTAEQHTLQSELDNAIDLLETLAAELGLQDAAPRRTEQGNEQLKTEVERLRADSEKSRTLAQEQQAELDLLMMELAVTDEKITQSELEAEAELAALMEQKNAFETIVSVAFAQMGQESLPILVNHLTHQQADIRRWAAVTLGEVGPLAREAIPPLLDVLRDPDEEVREAAKRALEKIDRVGP